VLDICEIASGSALDCDDNTVPDECDPDCNTNGLHDSCEVADGLSPDCNTDAVPDECDGDCNTNGTGDPCDIAEGLSADCNTNVFPDECEMLDAFWDNGPWDHTDGLVNQIGGIAPGEVAEDFNIGVPGQNIVAVTFQDMENTFFEWDGSVRITVWEDVVGVPSEQPFDQQWVHDPNVTRVIVDFAEFVGPVYEYSIETQLDVPGTGRFWFSATPSSQGANGQAFWCSSSVPPQFGQSYFRSPFFGFDTWTPTQDVVGQNYDFAFTLTFAGADCNTNGVVDSCEIGEGSASDCDANGAPDVCDPDCNTNGQADGCDGPDCNTNARLDDCDVASGTADCNTNGQHDACEIADGLADCEGDGAPDVCEVFGGTSSDSDGDGLLDECEPPPCATCAGDVNGDGNVDGEDVGAFVNCLLENQDLDEFVCVSPCADTDGDGDVDSGDVPLFAVILLKEDDMACP